MTGKTVVPSTGLAFPGECAPFILSASLVSKAAFNSTRNEALGQTQKRPETGSLLLRKSAAPLGR